MYILMQTHTSNAYDERSLRLFAKGLLDSGCAPS